MAVLPAIRGPLSKTGRRSRLEQAFQLAHFTFAEDGPLEFVGIKPVETAADPRSSLAIPNIGVPEHEEVSRWRLRDCRRYMDREIEYLHPGLAGKRSQLGLDFFILIGCRVRLAASVP